MYHRGILWNYIQIGHFLYLNSYSCEKCLKQSIKLSIHAEDRTGNFDFYEQG